MLTELGRVDLSSQTTQMLQFLYLHPELDNKPGTEGDKYGAKQGFYSQIWLRKTMSGI